MGLLDQVKSGLSGKLGGGSNLSSMLDHAVNLINNPATGGLSGLIESFKSKGLGDVVNSWVGTGQNLPVSVEQIKQVLGSEKIQEIAAKVGISTDEVANHLSNILPQVIDKLTPNGKLPNADMLEGGLSTLKKKFFGS